MMSGSNNLSENLPCQFTQRQLELIDEVKFEKVYLNPRLFFEKLKNHGTIWNVCRLTIIESMN